MGLTLRVDTAAWQAMVARVRGEFPDLIPVVKGNGYGFGREWLTRRAKDLGANEVAVGTVFEVSEAVALGLTAMVLTPSLDLDHVPLHPSVVPTVGSTQQVEHLLRFRPTGAAVVKVLTSMRRHGFEPDDAADAARRLADGGVALHSYAIHPGFHLDAAGRLEEVASILTKLPTGTRVTLSHLDASALAQLCERFPDRRLSMRVGSMLWHGDKQALQMTTAVLDVRRVTQGDRAGYRGVEVPGEGTLLVVGAGAAHGVLPLADGVSPFHFARRRLALLEAPHLHVSMLFVPAGDPVPDVGDRVDVQRPLITTQVDEIIWG